MALAIFDLDETLISIDSDHAWNQFVADRGLVDAEEHRLANDDFYRQYKAGRLDVNAYLRFACSVLARYPLDYLHAFRAEFVKERILPHILPGARDLVDDHRSRNDCLVVITSTIQFITEPIVDLFGISHLIAPVPEITGGRFTGCISGIPSFREGKVIRLEAWLRETGKSDREATFYSDSINDLALLSRVDHPVAVDPDPQLRAEAESRGWAIISLR